MSADWNLKLIALLHDPPDKVLALKDHQPRAFQRMERLIGHSEFFALFGTTGSTLTPKFRTKIGLWTKCRCADFRAKKWGPTIFLYQSG